MTATSSLPESVIVAPSAGIPGRKWSQIGRCRVRQSWPRHGAAASENSLSGWHFITVYGNGSDGVLPTAREMAFRAYRRGNSICPRWGGTVSVQAATIGEEITLS